MVRAQEHEAKRGNTLQKLDRSGQCISVSVLVTCICESSDAKVKYGVRYPKFIWPPVYSFSHWVRPRNSPLSPRLGSNTSALLVSQDRRHLFVTPCRDTLGRVSLEDARTKLLWQ
jgi:hypothetical protein